MGNCTCSEAGLSVAPPSAQVRPDETKKLVTIEHEPQIGETPPRALDVWLTPTPHFYVRNHFPIPDIQCSTWSLSIDGLVTRERRFTLNDLKRLPRVTLPVTMECAGNNRSDLDPPTLGNQFNNGAVSTAYWAGVRLSDVLKTAGIKSRAREVLFEGHDSGMPEAGKPEMPYRRSLPLDVALHADTLLAYEMNGEELPKEHGHPLRLIVPGWYGMASVKWLRRLTVIDSAYYGYFQGHKYVIENDAGDPVPLTTMGIKSLIGSPKDGEAVGMGRVCVTGMAWSGDKRIARVDFSSDGGTTWEEADIVGPSEQYAWQKWHYTWAPDEPGDYTLMSRAVDVRGNVQPMKSRWNRLGYMVNGVKPVQVTVSD